jgi:hypothetical protein
MLSHTRRDSKKGDKSPCNQSNIFRFQKKQELLSAQIAALCRSVRTESARCKVKQQEQIGVELKACSHLPSVTTGNTICGSSASSAAGLPSTRNCSANRKKCLSPDTFRREFARTSKTGERFKVQGCVSSLTGHQNTMSRKPAGKQKTAADKT